MIRDLDDRDYLPWPPVPTGGMFTGRFPTDRGCGAADRSCGATDPAPSGAPTTTERTPPLS